MANIVSQYCPSGIKLETIPRPSALAQMLCHYALTSARGRITAGNALLRSYQGRALGTISILIHSRSRHLVFLVEQCSHALHGGLPRQRWSLSAIARGEL